MIRSRSCRRKSERYGKLISEYILSLSFILSLTFIAKIETVQGQFFSEAFGTVSFYREDDMLGRVSGLPAERGIRRQP